MSREVHIPLKYVLAGAVVLALVLFLLLHLGVRRQRTLAIEQTETLVDQVRRMVGNDCRILIPTAGLTGGIFLLLVDDVARNLYTTELPLGILTAFIGAPFFIYLMARRGAVNQ